MAFKCLENCGKCCGPVPIPEEVFNRNMQKIEVPVDDFLHINGDVFAVGKDGACAFLGERKKCLIYDERPEVCRLYGMSNDPRLMCMFLKPNGRPRSEASQRQIDRLLKKAMGKFENVMEMGE
jgi:Fe-S-cluster containining protein